MRSLLLLLGLFAFTLSIHCTTENTVPNGYDEINRKDKGEIVSRVYSPSRIAEYWQMPQAGPRTTILLGQYQGVKARVLLRFYPYFSVDNASVTSAELTLNMFDRHGDGNPFTAQIYPLNDIEWIEKQVLWSDVQSAIDYANPVGELQVPALDSAAVTGTIDPQLVNDWIELQDRNNGILLDFESASFMASMLTTENQAGWATLRLAYTKQDGSADTVNVDVLEDVTLLEFDADKPDNQLFENPDRIHVGNFSGYRSLLEFDVSDIPEESTIHQAYVTLVPVNEESSTRENGMGLALNSVTDSLWNPATISIDSVLSAPTTIGLASADSVSFFGETPIRNMVSYVQIWTLDISPNYGLLLQSLEYGLDPSHLTFYGQSSDPALVPKLYITYSVPASSRFEL
jgi:hypothetical protein